MLILRIWWGNGVSCTSPVRFPVETMATCAFLTKTEAFHCANTPISAAE